MARLGGFHVNIGSGNLASETREARDFDRVKLTGVGTVVITQTGEESLTIEADDNILPLLTSEVHGGELELGMEHGAHVTPRAPIRFILTVKDLRGLSVSGAGDIELGGLKTDMLRLAISGTGALKTQEVSTGSLDVSISGAGSVSVGRLTASEVDATISGTGSVKLAGHAARQTVSIPGAGSYDAPELTSDQARVKVSGAGSARVNVRETLEARVSGIGSIHYAGQPQVQRSVSGLGSIRPIKG
ncbi:MAG TPA: head GIN domain-containing protein [Ktedonobacterales bacterium]